MENTPTFKINQSVCSAPDSSDITMMHVTWHAVIYDVRKSKTPTPDGYCYVTVGFWSGQRRNGRRATLRQLWSDSLVLDTSDKAMAPV